MDLGPASNSSYDAVLYPATIDPAAHPDRMATVATLRGMEPASPSACRVLEVGCGSGENLIALASNFPDSEFIGLDSAGIPVKQGKASILDLGLSNIQLQQIDLCDARQEQLGSFDYIIAHGLYSWVPPLIRDGLLTLCRELTNSQGIAYISYNVYPGNHLRDLARGIIRFHTMRSESPTEKARRARAILELLSNSRSSPNAYVGVLRSEFERLAAQPDELLFHDDLNEINQPFYFHEFVSAAQKHQLQFLGEACPDDLHGENLTPEMESLLSNLEAEEELVREQYRDFTIGRAFRRTLLCRTEVPLSSDFLPSRVTALFASCDAVPVQRNQTGGTDSTLFRRPNGAELETNHATAADSFRRLSAEWPCAIAFKAVLGDAQFAPGTIETKANELLNAWLTAYKAGFLQLHVSPPQVVNRVSSHPKCSALARYQLSRNEASTSQLHQRVRFVDPLGRELAQLLDGTRDQEAILGIILESVEDGRAELRQKEAVISDPHRIATTLKLQIQEILQALARQGFLVG